MTDPTGSVADRFEAFMATFLAKTLRTTLAEGPRADGPVGMFAELLDQEIGAGIARGGSLRALTAHMREPGGLSGHGAPDHEGHGPIARLTSGFGVRTDPIDGTRREHHGIDLGAPLGTPIHASAPGRVVFAGARGGYGNLVVVDHGDGVKTRYAHCRTIDVEVGQEVAAGERLAEVGNTGRSTGPHLHFELRRDDVAVDPSEWLERHTSPLRR